MSGGLRAGPLHDSHRLGRESLAQIKSLEPSGDDHGNVSSSSCGARQLDFDLSASSAVPIDEPFGHRIGGNCFQSFNDPTRGHVADKLMGGAVR